MVQALRDGPLPGVWSPVEPRVVQAGDKVARLLCRRLELPAVVLKFGVHLSADRASKKLIATETPRLFRLLTVLASKWVAAPLSALFWISCVLIVILWTPVMALFRLATLRSDPDRYRVGRLLREAAVLAVRINPFWDFRVRGEVLPDPRRPYVFVSNHASLADAFLIALLPWEMKWLSKRTILHIPLLGWQMRLAGDVELVRGDKESARRAMEELRRRLDRKLSVLIFPEGTRSRDGSLAPFRDGAFRLAIEAAVDVVPLAVKGTETALPKHSFVFRRTTATVTVLPPVSTAGLVPADAPRLAETMHQRIERHLTKESGTEGRTAAGTLGSRDGNRFMGERR